MPNRTLTPEILWGIPFRPLELDEVDISPLITHAPLLVQRKQTRELVEEAIQLGYRRIWIGQETGHFSF